MILGEFFIRRSSDILKTFLAITLRVILGLFVSAVICSSAHAQNQSHAAKLTSGAPLTCQFSEENSRSFQIAVTSGQLARILIYNNDVKLFLKLSGPFTETPISLVANPFRTTAVSFIPARSGNSTLEISPAQSIKDNRRFKISLEIIESPTLRHRRGIIAERKLIEAEKLEAEWTERSFLSAIRKYEEAAVIWATTGSKARQADALKRVGDILVTISNSQKAIAYYYKALMVSRPTGNRDFEIETLNSQASVLISLGRIREAEKNCADAEVIIRQNSEPRLEAQNVLNRGLIYYISGDMKLASDTFERAHALYLSANDDWGQAKALNHIGYALQDQGEIEKALENYQRALMLFQVVADQRGQAAALTVMGAVYSFLGEKQKALSFHNQALGILHIIGDRNGEAATLNGLAYVHEDVGDKKRALELYKSALNLYQTADNRNFECLTLGYIGKIYQDTGDGQTALKYHAQALRLSKQLGMRRIEAYALSDIGAIFADEGDQQKAFKYYEESFAISRDMNDRRAQALTLNGLGYIYELQGASLKATECYEKALDLIRGVEDRRGEGLTLHNLARVERDSGGLQNALAHIRQAIDLAESIRGKVSSQQLRASYFASVRQHYELCIDILMRLHNQQPSGRFDVAAFETSERGRARVLLETLNESHTDAGGDMSADLKEREAALRSKLATATHRVMQLAEEQQSGERASGARTQLENLLRQYEDLKAEIRERSPVYASLTQPSPASLRQIQQEVLNPDTMLLEYALGDDQSYLWAVTSDSIASYTLPKRSEIEPIARRLINITDLGRLNTMRSGANPSQIEARFWREADELSRILLSPVSEELREKRLLIVAEGSLQYVPFSALPDPSANSNRSDFKAPLILKHEVINLASASILFEMRRLYANRPAAPQTVAAFADPVFEKSDVRVTQSIEARKKPKARKPASNNSARYLSRFRDFIDKPGFSRLLSTRKEAQNIVALVPEGKGMMATDFKASKTAALSPEMNRYRIIHFATHGFLDSEYPELSSVVLSTVDEQGQFQDGFLGLHDIYNLKLNAELVVLSACSTALGKDIRGEGLISVARGFMYAGVERVVASLWKIDDNAAAELVSRFYKKLLAEKLKPAAALRSAQIEVMQQKRWRSPIYWAPFLLLGEWK